MSIRAVDNFSMGADTGSSKEWPPADLYLKGRTNVLIE
jgi:hypothetical protein